MNDTQSVTECFALNDLHHGAFAPHHAFLETMAKQMLQDKIYH